MSVERLNIQSMSPHQRNVSIKFGSSQSRKIYSYWRKPLASQQSAQPPTAVDNIWLVYIRAIEDNSVHLPDLKNSGKFIINLTWSANRRSYHCKDQIWYPLKTTPLYSLSILLPTILLESMGSAIFADMLKCNNYVLNKFTALKMCQHLDTKFDMMNPGQI